MRSPLILHATSVASTHHSRLLAQFAMQTKDYLQFHVNIFPQHPKTRTHVHFPLAKGRFFSRFRLRLSPRIARGQYGHMLHQLSTTTQMILLVRAHFVHFPCRTKSCILDVSVCGVT